MDYLQIDFDGNLFTLNVWPIIIVENIQYKFGDTSYRDKLCTLITNIVQQVTFVENSRLVIDFETTNKILVPLDPNNPEIVTPEIGNFKDMNGEWVVF